MRPPRRSLWARIPTVLRRGLVGVVGVAVAVLGLALVPLPGPGWLVVFVGLSILATEYAVVHRFRERLRAQVRDRVAATRDRWQQRRR